MKKLVVLSLTGLVISTSLFVGCKKDLLEHPTEVQESKSDVFMNQNKILVFKDMDAFRAQTAKTVSTRFPDFVSMRSIFNEVDRQEEAIVINVIAAKETSTINWEKLMLQSELGKKHKKMVKVKQYADDNAYYYDMNIHDKFLSDFVTPDGLLIIGNRIYQFSDEFVKIITDGDLAKLPALNSATVTNKSNNIQVLNATDFVLGYTETLGDDKRVLAGCNVTWNRSNIGIANNKKIELLVNFVQVPDGSFNHTICTIGLVQIKRKVLGIWFNATASSITLEGAFSGPRSPYNNITNAYGYLQPNPFYMNYSSEVIHYEDWSWQSDPCYTMTSGWYKMRAVFDDVDVATEVTW